MAVADSSRRTLLMWLAALGAGSLALGIFVACEQLSEDARSTETQIEVPSGVDQNPGPPADLGARLVQSQERAGGFERVFEERTAAGGGPQLAAMRSRGIGEPVLASFAVAGNPEPRYSFLGGTFAQPLAGNEVAGAAKARLEAEFGATVHNFDGQTRTFSAGELGGEVRCGTLTAKAVDRKLVVCGWVDRWTIGYVIDSSRTGTEAELAVTLLAMRKDLEVVR